MGHSATDGEEIVELDTPADMLRWARQQSGLSQGELANALGAEHPQVVSKWERGLREPMASTFIRVLQACGYRVVIEPLSEEEIAKLLAEEPGGVSVGLDPVLPLVGAEASEPQEGGKQPEKIGDAEVGERRDNYSDYAARILDD